MLNIVAKFFLVLTSLSPVLGSVAVNQFERGKPWTLSALWLGMAVLLAIICYGVLKYAENNAQTHTLEIKEFERKDQEVLTFLFIYLLPFIRSEGSTFASEWLTSIYVLLVLGISIVQSGAFHFNPTMRLLFGYRFYAVKDCHGVAFLLISKKNMKRPGETLRTVGLAENVHLHTGDPHA